MKSVRTLLPGLTLLCLALPALAERTTWPPPLSVPPEQLALPANQPDDPGYGGLWQYWSFIPDAVANNVKIPLFQKQGTIGMRIDQAWQRSIGDSGVLIAIMDSGFKWTNRDLLNKWQLNRGELPPPDRSDCVGADPYDCNGDGVFNVSDYTRAPRKGLPEVGLVADRKLLARADKGDVNHTGYIDPQDLIAIFSDGTDADGNGYKDDICGWDFLWDDNDADDDVLNGGQGYSHGNGEAVDAAAEGNNGIDDIGICSRCMVLPLRPSDSFVGHASAQAMAIHYAVSRNAKVIQAAQIILTNSPWIQTALDHAWNSGTLFVASSADETSHHPMLPGNLEHTLLVNGVRYDGNDWNDPNNTTFLGFNNSTNWGGHLHLTSPVIAASSEATARTAGHMGLVFSYAKELGMNPPLSAAEAFQVAIESAYDIEVPGSYTNPLLFPSGPGWDPHFSYGRNDVRASLDMLASGRIPPVVDIQSPLWFQTFDPKRVPTLSIGGVIEARRAPGFDYVIEVARGLHPKDSEFQQLKDGSATAKVSGALATIDLAKLAGDTSKAPTVIAQPDSTGHYGGPHEFAITVRIRATAHYGGTIGDVKGENRKTLFVKQDDDLLPGFPRKLANADDASKPSAGGEASPRLVDLDGDGKDEIVLATGDARIHVMRGDGTELPGFPVRIAPSRLVTAHGNGHLDDVSKGEAYQDVGSTPAVGDIDGDGKMDIVIGTYQGEVHAIGLDGKEKANFPVRLSEETLPKEVPGANGIYAQTGTWTVQQALTFPDGGGQPRIDRTNELENGFFASPVLADMNGDGKLDIIQAGLDGYVHVWSAAGTELPGFPVLLRDPAGDDKDGFGFETRSRIITTPAVGDLDGDGKPEIVCGTSEVYEGITGGRTYVIRNAGGPADKSRWFDAYMPGWPVKVTGLVAFVLPYVGKGNSANPIIADIDGDGIPEIFTHAVTASAAVYTREGEQLFTSNPTITSRDSTSDVSDKGGVALIAVNSGSLGDLDGDGLLEYVDGTVAALDVVTGASGGTRKDYDHQLSAWAVGRAMKANKGRAKSDRVNAQLLKAWPRRSTDYQFLTNYTLADLDGDGFPEVISGNGGMLITAFDKDGKAPAGWPKLTGHWNYATPTVGDLDGDGYLDVVTVSRNGFLWAWKSKGRADQAVSWEGYSHDLRNTNNLSTPTQKRAGPKAATTTGGGNTDPESCSGCSQSGASMVGLLGMALTLIGRRRARS